MNLNAELMMNHNLVDKALNIDGPVETPGVDPKEKPEVEPDVLPDEDPGIQPGKHPGKKEDDDDDDDDDPYTETEIGDDPDTIKTKTTIM